LIVAGAALMFAGQILLILTSWWILGTGDAQERPFENRSIEFKLLVIVVVMPYVETLIGQWAPIRLLAGVLRQPWWHAWLGSTIVFTCLHGSTDRNVLSIFLGAMVLAGVFVIEARRRGRPVLCAYLTHALANAMVLSLQLLWSA
jgi:membrane protease YdiL (CAAX protease family)